MEVVHIFCGYFFRMPPLWVTESVEVPIQELVSAEAPPAVKQSCFWFVSVGTLMPVLFVFFVMVVVSAANAVRPFPIAIVLTANTVAIVAIAARAVFCFLLVI